MLLITPGLSSDIGRHEWHHSSQGVGLNIFYSEEKAWLQHKMAQIKERLYNNSIFHM